MNGLHAARLMVPTTVSPAARSIAHALAAERDIPVIESPVVGEVVVAKPGSDDVLVHSVPDLFGRGLDPPDGWRVFLIVETGIGFDMGASGVRYGRSPIDSGTDWSRRLGDVWKALGQQRRVRPVHAEPGPFGLPFIAPSGIDLPDDVRATAVVWPGLPDLIVVHPPEVSAWAAYDGPIEALEWI